MGLTAGRPAYSVVYADETILAPSTLGFALENLPDLAGPFRVLQTARRDFDETWTPVWGQHARIRDHGRELTVRLEEIAPPHRLLDLVFRAYDDGVAFRYVIPRQPALTSFNITDELTQFNFATDAEAWWSEAESDTYERDYRETKLSDASARGMQTPATFRTAGGSFVSIHEAALHDWAGLQLHARSADAPLTLQANLVPWLSAPGVRVKASAPHASPWRTIQLARTPGGLAESSLILNLNPPSAIADTSWIRPSKFMGVWWGMITGVWSWDHEKSDQHGATTERVKRYIDAASEMGIDRLLVEGWCHGWGESWRKMEFFHPAPDFDIEELTRYGREKGVSLVGHHETGGDIPNYERQMDEAFAYYAALGIDTVKTGYVSFDSPMFTDTPGGREHQHGQYMVRHYQRVIELAAKHRIMIDAHEPINDTGLSRTWPNFIAREGARGGEFNHFAGNPPRHTTILPFTRLLGGPMDYTPGLFDTAYQPSKPFSTRANQLALFVVIWSPLQMAADHYQAYQGEPAAQFIRHVPVGRWDETRVPLAVIGDYVVTARRSGERWYVGAVNDEHARVVAMPTTFLDAGRDYHAILYGDAADADYRSNPHAMDIRRITFRGGETLDLALAPGGGAALEIHPATDPLATPAGDAGRPATDTPHLIRAKHTDHALTSWQSTLGQRTARAPSQLPGQAWTFAAADDDTWIIRQGDRVLTALDETNGAAVTLAPDRGDSRQRWRLLHIAGSYYHIACAAGGRLLEIAGRNHTYGAAAGLWENAHTPNQVWWLEKL